MRVFARARPMTIGAAARILAFGGCLGVAVTGCAENAVEPQAPARPLAPYVGRAVELFDDEIEPATVGYAASDVSAPNDVRTLRDRTQTADGVVRARVETVTSGEIDGAWLLGFHSVETLAGTHSPPPDFTLQVTAGPARNGVLREFEAQSVGKTVVAFLSQFAGPGGRRETHFHIAPDNKKQIDAVRNAVLLGEVH